MTNSGSAEVGRRRLLVVAPVPEPACSHIEGLRLALGDPSIGSIDAHVTLVPPVNVRDDALDDALSMLRALGAHPPITTQIGPVETFAPATPVLYLDVVDHVTFRLLRDRIFHPPLSRPLSHEFIPHVTINRRASDDQIEHVPRTVRYRSEATFDVVSILEEHIDESGRRWEPFADVMLGSHEVVGRGGIETELTVSTTLAPDVQVLIRAVPADLVVVAARDDTVVGAVAASVDGSVTTVENLFVTDAERRTGVGRSLVARLRDETRDSGASLDVSRALPVEVTGFLRHVGAV